MKTYLKILVCFGVMLLLSAELEDKRIKFSELSDLFAHPLLIPYKRNIVEVRAYNMEGALVSPLSTWHFKPGRSIQEPVIAKSGIFTQVKN